MMVRSIGTLRLFILLTLAISTLLVWVLPNSTSDELSSRYLEIHVLDVGQGDAIFIETPDGVQVLIDGGPDSGVLRELGKHMRVDDRTIDMVVSTHPDQDHIGGLIDVLERYTVSSILLTEHEGDGTAASTYRRLVDAEGATIVFARRGQVFELGASTTLSVLFPESDVRGMESNTSSIVLQLHYGDTTYLFTGDAPKAIEEYLVLRDGEYLQSDVLKVGHHGSRTSTSESFLQEVSPTFAIISAGADNRYGHPHVEVTDLLFNHGVEVLQTAEEGTISFQSDGSHVWLK